MIEHEYILVRNLTNITNALHALRDVLLDYDHVIAKKELSDIQSKLAQWQERIHAAIKITEEIPK